MPLIESSDGAMTVPFVMVKLVVEALLEKVHAPPVPLNVTLSNASAPTMSPAIVLPVVEALNVTVKFPCVNIEPASASQLPPTVIAPPAVNVEPSMCTEPSGFAEAGEVEALP